MHPRHKFATILFLLSLSITFLAITAKTATAEGSIYCYGPQQITEIFSKNPTTNGQFCYTMKTQGNSVGVITVRKLDPAVTLKVMGYRVRTTGERGDRKWREHVFNPPKILTSEVNVIVTEFSPWLQGRDLIYVFQATTNKKGRVALFIRHEVNVFMTAFDAALPVIAQRLLVEGAEFSLQQAGILAEGTSASDAMGMGGITSYLAVISGSFAWSLYQTSDYKMASQDALVSGIVTALSNNTGRQNLGSIASLIYGFTTEFHRKINWNVKRIMKY